MYCALKWSVLKNLQNEHSTSLELTRRELSPLSLKAIMSWGGEHFTLRLKLPEVKYKSYEKME